MLTRGKTSTEPSAWSPGRTTLARNDGIRFRCESAAHRNPLIVIPAPHGVCPEGVAGIQSATPQQLGGPAPTSPPRNHIPGET